MSRPLTFALGFAVAVSLAGAATGCSTSSHPVEDAGEDAAGCAAAGGTCITGGALRCPITGPQACGAGGVCCLVNAAIQDAGRDADACPDISAVSYEQACTVDTDCIAVGFGNACFACEVGCPNSAINKSAEAQYRSDVAKSPANGADCGCPSSSQPCCVSGRCQVGGQCFDAVTACVEAGGQCVFGGCSNPGPQACGSAGMFCCLTSVPDAATDGGPADAGADAEAE